MTALSRFLSASRDNGYPYFQCLKKNNRFVWTHECEEAFARLKEYLASSLVLCKPLPGTPLRLYFTVIDREISSVIVQEQDRVQNPVYFVSKVLKGPKNTVSSYKKSCLGGGIHSSTNFPLLPEFYCNSDDRFAHPQGPSEARHSRSDGSLGS